MGTRPVFTSDSTNRSLSALDHLAAVFGPRHLIEHLEEELGIAARHHQELAGHLLTGQGAGTFDAATRQVIRRVAVRLANFHDASAATSTAMADTVHAALWPQPFGGQPMTRPVPWTVAVADTANLSHPSHTYVINAEDRGHAVTLVSAHHCTRYGWTDDRAMIVAAAPGTPPADAYYGWEDLRGIKAIRVLLEPDQVRQLARLRLRLRRWQTMMAPFYAARDADGGDIPPSAWHNYSDEAEAIAETLTHLLIFREDR